MPLYETHGEGAALASRCVILCETEEQARLIHHEMTGYKCDECTVKVYDMVVTTSNIAYSEFVFYSWNGDY